MLRQILSHALTLCLAGSALAGIPDLSLSTATIPPGAEGAAIYTLPNGLGDPFTVTLPGGIVLDASITLTLVDTDGEPIVQYPREDLWLETSGGGLVPCLGGTIADADTDINGQTVWHDPLFAGGCSEGEMTLVMVAGMPLAGGGLDLWFYGPDLNGDVVVNLSDIVAFTQMLGGQYSPCGDFNHDGVINLTDIVLMVRGIGADCP